MNSFLLSERFLLIVTGKLPPYKEASSVSIEMKIDLFFDSFDELKFLNFRIFPGKSKLIPGKDPYLEHPCRKVYSQLLAGS